MSGLLRFSISQCSLDSFPLAFSLLTTTKTNEIKKMINEKPFMKPRINQISVLEAYGSLSACSPVSELKSSQKYFKNMQ